MCMTLKGAGLGQGQELRYITEQGEPIAFGAGSCFRASLVALLDDRIFILQPGQYARMRHLPRPFK